MSENDVDLAASPVAKAVKLSVDRGLRDAQQRGEFNLGDAQSIERRGERVVNAHRHSETCPPVYVNTLRYTSADRPILAAVQREPEGFWERLLQLIGDGPQATHAKRLGVSQPTIGRWRKRDRVPDILSLAQICREYGVTADWLLGLDPSGGQQPKEKPRKAVANDD